MTQKKINGLTSGKNTYDLQSGAIQLVEIPRDTFSFSLCKSHTQRVHHSFIFIPISMSTFFKSLKVWLVYCLTIYTCVQHPISFSPVLFNFSEKMLCCMLFIVYCTQLMLLWKNTPGNMNCFTTPISRWSGDNWQGNPLIPPPPPTLTLLCCFLVSLHPPLSHPLT